MFEFKKVTKKKEKDFKDLDYLEMATRFIKYRKLRTEDNILLYLYKNKDDRYNLKMLIDNCIEFQNHKIIDHYYKMVNDSDNTEFTKNYEIKRAEFARFLETKEKQND